MRFSRFVNYFDYCAHKINTTRDDQYCIIGQLDIVVVKYYDIL